MSVVNIVGGISNEVLAPTPTSEMFVPFQINTAGDINQLSDPVQRAIQHIVAMALTAPGERVMRPTYGIGFQNMIFENNASGPFLAAATQLQSAFNTSEGGYTVISVVPSVMGAAWTFSVQFSVDQSTVVHQAVFDFQGNLVGAS